MKRIIFIAVTLMVLVSCKKYDEPEPRPDLLIKYGAWRMNITSAKITGGANWNDITSTIPTCTADNIFNFTNPNLYQQREGITKCVNTAPDVVESGTFAFSNNDQTLTVTLTNNTTRVYTIELLTQNTLTVVYTDPTGIVSTDYRVNFIH
jgi:hypothetical protein